MGWEEEERKGLLFHYSLPRYLPGIGSSTPSLHRGYPNPWMRKSADSCIRGYCVRAYCIREYGAWSALGSWAHGPLKRFETTTIQPFLVINNSLWRWKHFSHRPA